MNTYTPRQYIEIFHLLFLAQLGRKADKKFYALKGGCNMRFFFKSPRYSDDIGLDVQSITVNVLRKKVNNILNSKPFRDILQVREIEIEHITEHKQIETTQRWKLGLIIPRVERPLPTKIEFSRRGLEEHLSFESVDPEVIRTYELSPIMVTHYPAEIMCQQKIKTLISRKTAQARDIFDLHVLLTTKIKKINLSEEIRPSLTRAKENILSMDFAAFKSQVVSYLEPEDQPQYESEEVWDNMRLKILEALSEGCS
jgi:predicted nucleotidyltransferase component of viral defense system